MADLPLEGRTEVVEDKKTVPLSLEQRVDLMGQDIRELARGVNTQARLLESVILAFDHVVKKYLELTRKTDETKEETK